MTTESRLTGSNERSGGKLRTQVGPAAWVPIWIASAGLTDGEFRVYVALRSYADQDGDGCFPSARKVAKRALVAYTTARNALQKFNKIGLVVVEPVYRENGSQTSNDYLLIDVCPPELATVVEANQARWEAEEKARQDAAKATAKAAKAAKAQVKTVESADAPPTPHKVGGGYPTQGRGPTPGKVGRANPRKVALTTPGITTPITTPDDLVPLREQNHLSPDVPEAAPAVDVPKQERETSASTEKPQSTPFPMDQLVNAAIAKHPRWSRRVTQRAIQSELDDGRDPDLVAVAWGRFIAHPRTESPGFFQHPLAWWDDPAAPPADPQVPAPRRGAPVRCDECRDSDGWIYDPFNSQNDHPCTHGADVPAKVGASA